MTTHNLAGGLEAAKSLSVRAEAAADRLGKSVSCQFTGFRLLAEPTLSMVVEVLQELIDNAVAHGIESPKERVDAGKPRAGTCISTATETDSGEIQIVFHDDGKGIDHLWVANRAVELGLMEFVDPDRADPRKVMGLVFHRGFSRSDADSAGMGLFRVAQKVNKAGGKLRLRSTAGEFTEFHMLLPG